MADGDVETVSKRGQWVNRVMGDEAASRSFASKEEAIDAGREYAEHRGTEHRVLDSEATGVITDGGDEGDRVDPLAGVEMPQPAEMSPRGSDAGAEQGPRPTPKTMRWRTRDEHSG